MLESLSPIAMGFMALLASKYIFAIIALFTGKRPLKQVKIKRVLKLGGLA